MTETENLDIGLVHSIWERLQGVQVKYPRSPAECSNTEAPHDVLLAGEDVDCRKWSDLTLHLARLRRTHPPRFVVPDSHCGLCASILLLAGMDCTRALQIAEDLQGNIQPKCTVSVTESMSHAEQLSPFIHTPSHVNAAPLSQRQPQEGNISIVQHSHPVGQTLIANIKQAANLPSSLPHSQQPQQTLIQSINGSKTGNCTTTQVNKQNRIGQSQQSQLKKLLCTLDDNEDFYDQLQWKKMRQEFESSFYLQILNLALQQMVENDWKIAALELGKDEREEHIRPKFYAERVVPLYSHMDFKSHFRLDRTTMEILLQNLARSGLRQKMFTGGNEPLEVSKMTLIAIWYLANEESMRGIADRFDVAKSTVHMCLKTVSSHLCRLIKEFIIWPTGHAATEVIEGFKRRANFPGVVGAIDGSHILIEPPSEHQREYLNRKMSHSVVLQAVCDSNRKFTHCFVGYPGSAHDARVYQNSVLYKKITDNRWQLFDNENNHLVGDSAYPLSPWLMVPFKDNGNLDDRHLLYNQKLSQTRIIIECTFALLKGRFRRLRKVISKVENISELVLAACVLHNLCLDNGDGAEEFVCQDDMDFTRRAQPGQDDNQEAQNKRNFIMASL